MRQKGKKGFWEFLVLAGICMFVAGLFIRDGKASGGTLVEGGRKERELPGSPGDNGDSRDLAEALAGTLEIAGSTSMEHVTWALAESFMEEYPQVTVTVECIGSSAGIEAVAAERVQIGNTSRALKQGEQELGLVEVPMARDGIAVCVDPANLVKGITREQLGDIYAGRITNWQQLGGRDIPIVVIGREAGSGTRSAFEAYLGLSGQCRYANELDSAGAVLARIASIPGAIGYLSMAEADHGVRTLCLDGVEPCAGHVAEGRYPLARPFVMVAGEEDWEQNVLVRTWFTYVLGTKGQEIIEEIGLAGP